jgi:hypothetical protein
VIKITSKLSKNERARLYRAAEKHEKENVKMKTYNLNKDWKEFEPALKKELEKLNASSFEIEQILDGAWEAATEVNDVKRYAEDELNLLREK